jgi:hypothetical protein
MANGIRMNLPPQIHTRLLEVQRRLQEREDERRAAAGSAIRHHVTIPETIEALLDRAAEREDAGA